MNPVYVDQVINPLKELVLQDTFDNIPDIIINPNSDLNLVSSNVASLAVSINENDSEGDQITDIFKSIGIYFDDDRNISRLSIIDQMSKSFAQTLEQSYNTLNSTIIPRANDIKEKITNRFHELLIREKADNLIELKQVDPSEADYTFINWNIKGPVEVSEIVEIACSNAGINIKDLSQVNLSYILAKMNFSKEMNDVSLPKEINDKLCEKLIVFFEPYKLDESAVREFFNIITSPSAYSNFCTRVQMKINDSKNVAQNVLNLINTTALATIFTSYCKQQINDDLNPETLQDISDNVDIFVKTIYAIKYWILIVKEFTFKNSLIITDNIINGHVYDNFIREGKSISDIYKYLKAFHYDSSIPTSGIDLSTVLEADANQRLDKINARISSNDKFIKSKCLINAFAFVIQQVSADPIFVETFPELKDSGKRLVFIKFATANSSMLNGNIDNVDNVVLNTIVNFFYKNSLISTLYKYLGKNFSDLVSSESDIDSSSILQSQCSACIELLTDFLFDNGVCEKA